jgi:hypothetical protein
MPTKNDLIDLGGATTFVMAIYMKALNWFNLANFNELIITITGLAGLVFIIFKIRLANIELKQKKKDYEKDTK